MYRSLLVPFLGVLYLHGAGQASASDPAPLLLRPHWESGKVYRLQQDVSARTRFPGFGKQNLQWRQEVSVSPQDLPQNERSLEIKVEGIRVDLDFAGGRSRYYFRPGAEKRFQDGTSFQEQLLGSLEQMVDGGFHLQMDETDQIIAMRSLRDQPAAPSLATGTSPATPPLLTPAVGSPLGEVLSPPALGGLSWQGLTSALLHQGIPNEPVIPGAAWDYVMEIPIAGHGNLAFDLRCRYDGLRNVQERELAVIEFAGSLTGNLHQDLEDAESPAVTIEVPKVQGLTLIDPTTRAVMSTVIKFDGNITTNGIPGTIEGETAPLTNTLILTLLEVDPVE